MMKKISAIILAIMMIAMCAAAWAANTDDSWNNYNGVVSTDNTIGIAKEIVFVNAENTTVREPNITYTYTIASATPGTAKITGVDVDNNAMTLPVNAGPIAAVSSTTATVTFADTATQAASVNGSNSTTKYANFTFNPATFGAPGIYRYSITESTNVTKASVGIAESTDYAAGRFLDVYVHWTDNAHTTLGIYGYVLFEGTADTSIAYDQSTDLAKKSQGYVNTATTSGSQADVDVYTTQNLVISKVTTGALADVNNDFPVTITFTKATGLSNSIKLDYAVTGNGALTKVGTDTNSVDYVTMDNALSGTVRNGSTITITGIPTGSAVTMTETNNTVDFYRVKAGTTAGGDNLLAEAVVSNSATSGSTSSVTIENAKKEIHFTNTLSEISPTGYVSRFAPYALILVAGVVLLVLAKKHRKHETED